MKSTEINKLVISQREFFLKGTTLDINVRINALKKLYSAIKEHEEEIYDRLTCFLLGVESVPSCLVDRLVAWRDVACGFYAEAILDEREEVAHEQRLSDEAHDQAVESENEQAVGVGTDIALHR